MKVVTTLIRHQTLVLRRTIGCTAVHSATLTLYTYTRRQINTWRQINVSTLIYTRRIGFVYISILARNFLVRWLELTVITCVRLFPCTCVLHRLSVRGLHTTDTIFFLGGVEGRGDLVDSCRVDSVCARP